MSEKAEQVEEQPADAGFFTPEDQEQAVTEAEEQAERGEDPTPGIEDLARSMGWHEMENGKTAFEFIRDTADINRSLRSRIERMDTQIESLVQNTAKQTMAALKAQRERLQKQFDEAVESGDKAAARKASDEMKEIDSQKEGKSEDPLVGKYRQSEWIDAASKIATRHPDIREGGRLHLKFMKLVNDYAVLGGNPSETYENAYSDLTDRHPELLTNQNRERPAKVGGDKRPSSADKSAWGKLMNQEPDAESVFKQLVEDGVYKADTKENREKFAKLALDD